MTQDEVWPFFDGWCIEHGIDPIELPADRCVNLIYYFATRNMNEQQKTEFDGHMGRAGMAYVSMQIERTSVTEGRSTRGPGESNGDAPPVTERARRLPPRPAWYGSSEQATRSSLAAKATLTSRNGARTPRR